MDRQGAREELRRVLASPDFDASARNRRFLAYVVGEALSGRERRIKAYGIATTVFGRGADFDPQTDPIVRIEAGRLRRSLERYYLKAGSGDPLRISIPKGGYAPAFDDCGPARREMEPAFAPPAAPSIRVAEFEQDDDGAGHPGFCRALTRSVLVALTRCADLDVFGPGAAPTEVARLRSVGVDYALSGDVVLAADGYDVEALMTDLSSGRAVWADNCAGRFGPGGAAMARREIADRIARRVAQACGAVCGDRAPAAAPRAPGPPDPRANAMRPEAGRRTSDPAIAAELRGRPERATAAEPHETDARAFLSRRHIARFNQGVRG